MICIYTVQPARCRPEQSLATSTDWPPLAITSTQSILCIIFYVFLVHIGILRKSRGTHNPNLSKHATGNIIIIKWMNQRTYFYNTQSLFVVVDYIEFVREARHAVTSSRHECLARGGAWLRKAPMEALPPRLYLPCSQQRWLTRSTCWKRSGSTLEGVVFCTQ